MPDCRKCGNNFPYNIWIDGKLRNLQHRKYCFDCSPFKSHNTTKLEQFTDIYYCPRCNTKKTVNDFYTRSENRRQRVHSWCKKCTSYYKTENQREHKIRCVKYKGGCCEVCGYKKNVSALVFHHLDPNKKEFAIGTWRREGKWAETKKELDKCKLVCCNCHAEIHYPEYGLIAEIV